MRRRPPAHSSGQYALLRRLRRLRLVTARADGKKDKKRSSHRQARTTTYGRVSHTLRTAEKKPRCGLKQRRRPPTHNPESKGKGGALFFSFFSHPLYCTPPPLSCAQRMTKGTAAERRGGGGGRGGRGRGKKGERPSLPSVLSPHFPAQKSLSFLLLPPQLSPTVRPIYGAFLDEGRDRAFLPPPPLSLRPHLILPTSPPLFPPLLSTLPLCLSASLSFFFFSARPNFGILSHRQPSCLRTERNGIQYKQKEMGLFLREACA